jgi:O-acetyl-ADP-ribose deacetylase (regulator of RNase III)
MISACLWKAHQKKYKSIAFPTVGAGHFYYPKNVVTSAFVDSCKKFAQSYPQTSLTDIRLVVFYKDTDMLEVCCATGLFDLNSVPLASDCG